jgi:predicted nucleotidyltransferase component of viral defense system
MISSKIIHKTSNKEGVRPQQIEKDYIISWILWGISRNDFLKDALVFKGGTCLKKIHIEGIELQDVYYEFERKAAHKGHIPADFIEKVTAKQKTYENAWRDNLNHQIKDLPNFKDVWRRIGKQLRQFEKIK